MDGQTVLSPEQIYAANLGATVGVNGNVDTNVFGYTVKNAVSGSGFVIGSNGSSSYILTNYHVIDGVQRHQGVFLRRQELWRHPGGR